MLVVVSIMGILAALAVPSFSTAIDRFRVSAVVDELSMALNLTRVEAIKRNGNVRLMRLSGGSCPALGSAQEWSCGWQVFQDTNNNQALDAGEEIIREFRITSGVVVNNQVNSTGMTANRWGQIGGINAVGFVVLPSSGVGSPATTSVCMSSGGRIRKASGSVTC
jgi:type IV fimbrial biogenesis protein FimT